MQDTLPRRISILNLKLKKLRDTRKTITSWGKSEKDNSPGSISLDFV